MVLQVDGEVLTLQKTGSLSVSSWALAEMARHTWSDGPPRVPPQFLPLVFDILEPQLVLAPRLDEWVGHYDVDQGSVTCVISDASGETLAFRQ